MSQSPPSRYLWAAGAVAAQIQPPETIQSRYQVVAPQVWRDLQPESPPLLPSEISQTLQPYLKLFPWRLHVPEIYGMAVLDSTVGILPDPVITEQLPKGVAVLLLDQVPIDPEGNLLPAITEALSTASVTRQLYWLWQLWELWQPLQELGVAASLLVSNNIRVDGWRVRLLELYADAGAVEQPSVAQLGTVWGSWYPLIDASVGTAFQELCQGMQSGELAPPAIARTLNQLLLSQTALLPLRLRVAGITDTGPRCDHNEDSCFPTATDLTPTPSLNPLIPNFAAVCDGIGGHEGGEVASQLAIQTLKLQFTALIKELEEDPEILPPDVVQEQIAATIRVVNNLISSRNDEQGRESRRRMGTTLVMALQLPQQVKTPSGMQNAHELYIAHVGDSRAYWMTADSCTCVTVDDDVCTREIRLARSLPGEARRRPDAGALTQALGTKDGESLRPTVRRLILEEDGVLLLCSDGLSDRALVEQSWQDYTLPILQGKLTVEEAAQAWLALANQKNGHDNTSIALTYCRVSPEYPVLLNLGDLGTPHLVTLPPPPTEPVFAQPVMGVAPTPPRPKNRLQIVATLLGILILLLGGATVGLLAWWQLDPQGVQQWRDRLLSPSPSSTSPPQQ